MNKATQETMFSSKTGEWSTPQDFFDKLDWRFGPFTLDPCATQSSHKCKQYYTEADDGLSKNWEGNTIFINPPYGRGIDKWIEKGYLEGNKPGTKVVMLIPARTDTKYWHKYVMRASELYFVKGRLKFGDSSNSAPFPSAVVVFSPEHSQRFGAMNR
jgi:site-specific DNA-methyltransferase (adenine-specific)